MISLQFFYTFPILPFKVEKNEAENSWNVPFFGNFRLPCLTSWSVKWKVGAASWKKNDPILETREIAL